MSRGDEEEKGHVMMVMWYISYNRPQCGWLINEA